MATAEERTKKLMDRYNKADEVIVKLQRIIKNAKAHNVSQQLIYDLEKKVTELNYHWEKIIDAEVFLRGETR